MNEKRIEEILSFWFGDLPDDETFPDEKAKMWFAGSKETDDLVKKLFGKDLKLAIEGKLDGWSGTARGALALILVLDQFSRHIYRDDAQSFAQDFKALEICLHGLARGDEKLHRPVERSFFYMPLEHSEDLEIQSKSLHYFSRLAEESPAAIQFPMVNAYDYAARHFNIIEKFGRFPHRNEILGRSSTRQEQEFLTQSGSSF